MPQKNNRRIIWRWIKDGPRSFFEGVVLKETGSLIKIGDNEYSTYTARWHKKDELEIFNNPEYEKEPNDASDE